MDAKEVIERLDPVKPFPIITYNTPYHEACAKHLSKSLGCSRPLVVISGSLADNTDAIQLLTKSIGEDRVAGFRRGMKPHTFYSEVLEIADQVKTSGADCIITVGGGSLVDGAKAIALVTPPLQDGRGRKPDCSSPRRP